ncbi:PASTA domain-containing protein [Mycolicibacterium murale]|uniref:PASTA domain-containing protein n=2 Tax=Mycolicibacterium murale TaxID=182220 RepID=UPI003908AE5C
MRALQIAVTVLVLTVGCAGGRTPAPASAPASAGPVAPDLVLFAMPDITGMFWAEAEQVLGAAGWSGSVVKEPDVAAGEYSANQIAFQSPAPGQPVEATTKITVRFAQ